MASRLPVALFVAVWMPGTSRSIRPSWHHWRGWHWILVTFKPKIWWGWRWWGGAGHSSCCPWPQSFCNAWPHSWHNGLGTCLGTPHHSMGVEGPSTHGDQSWLLKLNSIDEGGMEWGCPGPLGSICLLVMAWAINYWPSPRLTGLGLRRACLQTQQMAPDKANEASFASPKLSPSPHDCHPENKMAWPELVTTAPVRLDLPSQTMSFTTGTCLACGGGGIIPPSLVEITCISKQYWVSEQSGVSFLTWDWDGEHDGVLPDTDTHTHGHTQRHAYTWVILRS